VACSLLALPWAIAASAGATPYGWWIPFAIGLGGVWQSLHTREEVVDYHLRLGDDAGELRRFPEALAPARPSARPLTIVQITDPHLGPFMSEARLRRICERAVERDPDLVLVTGDLMTMESHDVELVSRAIEPLSRLPGRVFACHGNHDHEARQVVATAYARTGVELLVDEATTVDTRAGRVQIVGADFVWRHRAVHLQSLCERFPREPDALRIVMLHDPGAFAHLPDGEGDLVLSGHTHGGQVGLLSLGLRSTFVSAVTSLPDHGPWARGRNRLYVHRAQGLYGFPIRLGVPGEESLMRVHV
jgi:predicted MPP superfamily phosphohydrolase